MLTFEQFLANLLTLQGMGVGLGVITSLILEYWPNFEDVPYRYKRVIVFLICIVLALFVVCTQVLFGYVVFEGFVPLFEGVIWPSIINAITIFTSSQITHSVITWNDKVKEEG